MSIFKRKHDFRPDKERANALSKLYITKKQRLTIAKWLLMALVLVVVSVLQDVVMSRVSLFGATTDLVPVALLTACIMLDPESGSVFVLVASALYYFSGTAPGPHVILLITLLGILVAIVRQNYLRYGFFAVALCAAGAMMLYELTIYALGFFLGQTTGSRFMAFVTTGLLSLAAIPILYPIFTAIGKIGGETWKE